MATPIDLARRLLAAAENDELMARSVLPVYGVTPFALAERYGSSPLALDREKAMQWAADAVTWARAFIDDVDLRRGG